MTIDQAIAVAKRDCRDPYAQAYLRAIPDAIELGGTDGFESQLLYALNNMRSWCGETARVAKQVMRQFVKECQHG